MLILLVSNICLTVKTVPTRGTTGRAEGSSLGQGVGVDSKRSGDPGLGDVRGYDKETDVTGWGHG